MNGRNDTCWCGSQKKWKHCHFPLKESDVKTGGQFLTTSYWTKYGIRIKNSEQIKGIRSSCELAAQILDKVCLKAQIGVTTEELNIYAHNLHLEAGALPAPLNYGEPPFPKSICTSLNEVICHGIPDNIPLKAGDILNIDVSCILNGYFGDCSKMVILGEISKDKQLVVEVAYEALMRSITILKPGVYLSEIGEVIESYAELKHCSVVNQFVGHGVGLEFHENPQVPHCRNHSLIPLAAGMTFTIEPMINAGVVEGIIDPKNHWTVRTKDNKPSAQYEHTLLITKTGCEILTPWHI